jgi:hypothetical protein
MAVVAIEVTKPSDSLLESSTTPYDSMLTSSSPMVGVMISSVPTEASPFSFFTIKASPCKSTRGKEEAGTGAAGDARGEDNDAEGDDGGMTLVDCPGESLSSKRGILQW